jgi:hypothetical protein
MTLLHSTAIRPASVESHRGSGRRSSRQRFNRSASQQQPMVGSSVTNPLAWPSQATQSVTSASAGSANTSPLSWRAKVAGFVVPIASGQRKQWYANDQRDQRAKWPSAASHPSHGASFRYLYICHSAWVYTSYRCYFKGKLCERKRLAYNE